VGGLSYRPLHCSGESAETRFTRILRHLLAEIFCLDGADSATARDKPHRATGRRKAASSESVELLKNVAPFRSRLEEMAVSAARCATLCGKPTTGGALEISARVQELNSTLEKMKARAEEVPAVKPVVHFLDWQCRMMPPLSPCETFRAHEKEYRMAADLLAEGGRRLEAGT
jgi:hypothetical protein